ncbi:flagellar filament capping protein FliD [Chitiniphilus shinanonensis]|uniref:flagellar filament capping protein FliD n=1 Tax=Chitiniphilus shinanonensis TaxID=553088 RepID=UPI00306DABAA
MAISSAGLGSGLNVNGIISQLMQIESQPLDKLNSRIKEAQTKISAIGSLQSSLSSFQARVLALSSNSAYKSLQGSLTDSTIGTVVTSAAAQQGSYSLAVSQLAQSHKLKSEVYSSASSPVGTGKLTIQFGTFDDGGTPGDQSDDKFSVNGEKGAMTIEIDSKNNTLTGLRDAINNKNAGVTATIINDGGGYRLLLSSTDSGVANSMRIQVEDTDGNNTDTSGLSKFAYDPTGTSNLSQTQAAQNALFTLDGIEISKSSNSVSDLLQGVTLNLQKVSAKDTTTGKPVSTTLNITRDTTGVKKSVQEFVDAYNEFVKGVDELSFYNQEDKTSGLLTGDYVIRSMQNALRSTLNERLGDGSFYQSLTDVGISFDKAGKMTLDNSKLQKALDSRPEDVASLFAQNGVASDARVTFTSSTTSTKTGKYDIEITQPAMRAQLTGLAIDPAGPFTITEGDNDTIMVAVDGVSSKQIKLTAGSYSSPAALAAEIQSQINGDANLKGAGVSVSMAFNATTNQFEMTSTRYGSASKVQITSTGAQTELFGLKVGQRGEGKDVAGTINGAAATGSGQVLNGTGPSEGLKLTITGDTAGYYGTLSLSRGFASRLDQTLNSLLSDKGAVQGRINGLNQNIKDMNAQGLALNRRLDATEKRYRDQFTALDVQMSKMSGVSSYLTQQLSMLSNLASGK